MQRGLTIPESALRPTRGTGLPASSSTWTRRSGRSARRYRRDNAPEWPVDMWIAPADLPTYPQALRRRLPPPPGSSNRKETVPAHSTFRPRSVAVPTRAAILTITTQC
jgi:hypothetical protein